MPNQPCLKISWNENQSSTSKLSSNEISPLEIKTILLMKKGGKLLHTAIQMLVGNWKEYNSKSDCFIWILTCSFCCSHILHFLHILLCWLIDERALLEYTVNQQGFTFREKIDKGALLERKLTKKWHFWRDDWQTLRETIDQQGRHFRRDNWQKRHFWRDDWQGGTFRETIDKGALLERQSINKGGTFGETQRYRYNHFDNVVAAR